MSDIVIRAEGLGKRYRIGERERYLALRDTLARAVSAPARLFRARKPSSPNGDPAHIWALKDVSFEVRQGEVMGIIGRNGAGKTTLLKILVRVTMPTEGCAEVRGRMGSLLEVGTGFHPELTGRENTYLNGAILGMSKKEVARKFDEIVAFAEIEKFIDTPLKYYSSGMYVRLAFAVAAHLEPEILVIDEVLAVGDGAFQRKCLGKMDEVARQGRTVLFVSHNLAAVGTLCHNAILLSAGRIDMHGVTQAVISKYAAATNLITGQLDLAASGIQRRGDGTVRFVGARLLDENGEEIAAAVENRRFRLELTLKSQKRTGLSILSVTLVDQFGNDLWTTMHYDSLDLKWLDRGTYRFAVDFQPNFLARGSVEVRLACFGPHFYEYDHVFHAFVIAVAPACDSVDTLYRRPGTVNVPAQWSMQSAEV
jgi:lipopolysaccharide transport system ATP-binding protein